MKNTAKKKEPTSLTELDFEILRKGEGEDVSRKIILETIAIQKEDFMQNITN